MLDNYNLKGAVCKSTPEGLQETFPVGDDG